MGMVCFVCWHNLLCYLGILEALLAVSSSGNVDRLAPHCMPFWPLGLHADAVTLKINCSFGKHLTNVWAAGCGTCLGTR